MPLTRNLANPLTAAIARGMGGGGAGLAIPHYQAQVTPITTFASGWFHGGTATASTLTASDSEVGTHAAVTTGATGTGQFSIYNQTPVNMTGRHFVVRIKMDDYTAIGGLNLRVSDDVNVATRFTDLRVTGGNEVNAAYSVGDGWVDVTFSWADAATTGTVDRSAIRSFQFRPASFGSKSTVVRFDSLGYVEASGPYGIISFDDGWASAALALPKLDALGFHPVMYVIVDLIGTTNYMTLADLVAWETTHGGEVAGHCYAVAIHNATNSYASVSIDECAADMQQLRAFLHGSNALSHAFSGRNHFAWPKGQFDSAHEAVQRRFFSSAALATNPWVAQAWPAANPYRLARFPVTATTAPAQIQAQAQKAMAAGTAVEFMFHEILASGATGATQYNLTDFEAAMDLVAATGLPIKTKSQVFDLAY